MRTILLSLIILLSLTSCNEDKKQAQEQTAIAKAVKVENDVLLAKLKAKEDALQKARLEAKIAKEKLLAEEASKKEAFLKMQAQKEKKEKASLKNEKLSKVGISIENSTITIDTNKTKDFFQNLSKALGNKLKKITTDIEKGMIDQQDAGVKIDDTHINIDLNKSKDFLEAWGKKMQEYVKDFDAMAKVIDVEKKQLEQNTIKGN